MSNPTPTGEWSIKYIRKDIHESALAAERLRTNQKQGAFMVASEANQQLREQLAAAVEALHELLCDSRKREKAEALLASIGDK
jgi:hypothetical protein